MRKTCCASPPPAAWTTASPRSSAACSTTRNRSTTTRFVPLKGKGTTAPGQIDFALLTDGLRAEREQGITIDVAYRYFSTARRKFIIADTPGHEQYTRNMATGASTADAAVVLIDATRGVLPQSRRHACIAALLARAPHPGRRQQNGSGRLQRRRLSRHRARLRRRPRADCRGNRHNL